MRSMTTEKMMTIMTLYSVYYDCDGDDLVIIMSFVMMMIRMTRIMTMIAMMCN